MRLAAQFIFLLLILPAHGCWNGSFSGNGHDYLRQAEEASRQKNWDEAISDYNRHIEQRLKIDKRPEWENPWFYMLMIGDLELGRGNPREAVAAFEKGREQGVDKGLVSDRLRLVASWYEQHDRLKEAVDLLAGQRKIDPMLFDLMLDRLTRELTKKEDAAAALSRK